MTGLNINGNTNDGDTKVKYHVLTGEDIERQEDQAHNNIKKDRSKRVITSGLLLSVLCIGSLCSHYNAFPPRFHRMDVVVKDSHDSSNEIGLDEGYANWSSKMNSRVSSMKDFPVDVAAAITQKLTAGNSLTYLNNTEAYSMAISALHEGHYFQMNLGHDAQVNNFYCGAASIQTTLNSVRIYDENKDPWDNMYAPYHYSTQHTIFDSDCARKNVFDVESYGLEEDLGVNPMMTAPYGLSLKLERNLLQCNLDNKWQVEATHVDPNKVSLDKMRQDIVQALEDKTSRVIALFDRAGLGQVGGGHFSPIAAYDEGSDSFLILDVAKYKYPPVWAPAALLYNAMASVDLCGVWNWPNGQKKLPKELKMPQSEYQWAVARILLDCQPMHRGYIIASRLM